MFFFEKKNQKTFIYYGARWDVEHATACKSFLLLFFKKEAPPLLVLAT